MKRRREKEQDQKHWDEVRKEFNFQLRLESEEGQLPDGLGNYRIHLPYFESPGGATLAFLRSSHDNGEICLRKIGRGYCYVVTPLLLTSWKGMRTGVEHRRGRLSPNRRPYGIRDYDLNCIAEIDWVSSEAGKIGVSRNAFAPMEKALAALQWLEQRSQELQSSFLKKNHKSVYATLNSRLLNAEFTGEGDLNWITFENDKGARKAKWKIVHPPFVNALSFPYQETGQLTLTRNSNPVSVVSSLPEQDDNYPHAGLGWCPANSPPEKVIARVAEQGTYSPFALIPFWATKLLESPNTHVAGVTCAYPPEWKHLCGAQFEMYSSDGDGTTVWNQDNSILKSVNASAWEWSVGRFQESLDPLPHKASLLADKGKASSWIILCLVRAGYEVWDGLKDRDPDFLTDLWALLFGPRKASRTEKAIYQWVEDSVDSRLRILTPQSWISERARESQNLHNLLPIPKPEWCLFVRDENTLELLRRIKLGPHESSTGTERRKSRSLSRASTKTVGPASG